MHKRQFLISVFLAFSGVSPAVCATYDALEIVPFDIPADVNLPDSFKEALKHDLVAQLQQDTGLLTRVPEWRKAGRNTGCSRTN